ncbi:unnamed protein product [Blepharisma stoltei]|uniref:TNFR-Cys domain-containing protein n=1 Tax=Blepharisma stoltei TaxID=1481888 RepID=A0AAU9J5K7_9CILI|nr:unnamed protein product [Blepharisma stoltei]
MYWYQYSFWYYNSSMCLLCWILLKWPRHLHCMHKPCSSCNSATVCKGCIDGCYLDSTTCKACTNQCANCSSAQVLANQQFMKIKKMMSLRKIFH